MDKLQCIKIIKSMNIIVGVLSTAQPVKFGKTNSGKPIYQIKPFKKILPPFWITYAGKLKGRIIIAFKFRDWKDDSKLPFGEIVEIIGIQDDSILTKTLMQHYEIDRKNFKKVIQLNSNETQIIRKDLKHLDVFSIDPLGCIDIDDALSLEKNDNKIYIGVHIAQPICWLTKEDILERSKKAFSTLYLNDTNKNLWSDELTENASLLQGKEKPTYSVIFEISNSKIINIESFPSTIINKLTTDYDSINFKNIIEVKEITEKILEKEIDSHELVSFWMVKTNEYIGNNFDNIPFRIQNEIQSINQEISDIKIKTIFNNFMLEGAKYSYEKNYHFSLNISNYTHFTSPIRRIIDTIIHWNITYKNHQITINLDDINIIDNKTKKFHRQLKLIESIKNLPEEIETTGWVFSIKENKLMVYFEEIGLTKVKLWHDKFNYLNMENNVKIGMGYPFKIIKKVGFMPSEKLVILKI